MSTNSQRRTGAIVSRRSRNTTFGVRTKTVALCRIVYARRRYYGLVTGAVDHAYRYPGQLQRLQEQSAGKRIGAAVLALLLVSSGCVGLVAAGQRDREGQELRRQHRYRDAALAYEEAYLGRARILGPEHRDVALTMTAAGQCFNLAGNPRKGLDLLGRALPIVEREVGPMSDSVGATLYAMADAEWKLSLLDSAEAHQRRAVQIGERNGWRPLEFSNLLAQLGRILVDKGQVDEAYRVHLQAFAMRRALRPPAPALVAQSQNNLGVLHQVKGDFARARDHYAQALATLELGGEEATPTYSGYLRDYGASLYELKDYAAAERVARQALVLDEQILAPGSLDIGHSAGFLGMVLLKEAKVDDAAPLLRRALSIRERELGVDHDMTLASLVFLARCLEAQGDVRAAEVLWRRYLRSHELRLGPAHPETGAAAFCLAECLRLSQQTDEAERLYFRALRIATDKNTKGIIGLASKLATLSGTWKDADSWESLFSDVVAVARRRGAGAQFDTAIALGAYGRVLAARQKCAAADAAFDEAVEIAERTSGPQNSRAAELRDSIRRARCSASRRHVPDRTSKQSI